MTDERLTELNDRYWHMNPNPKKVPFAPGVTPEFTICRSCSTFVWEQEVHDTWHAKHITRHASWASVNSDQSTTVRFIDGSEVTLEPTEDGPMPFDEVMEFLRHQNDLIEPGWSERNPMHE